MSKYTYKPLKKFFITKLTEDGGCEKVLAENAYALEHNVYKTIVVHPGTLGVGGWQLDDGDWVATEKRTGFAIATGSSKQEATRNAIKRCDAKGGVEAVSAAVKRCLKWIRKNLQKSVLTSKG